jgi:hypothetical protein
MQDYSSIRSTANGTTGIGRCWHRPSPTILVTLNSREQSVTEKTMFVANDIFYTCIISTPRPAMGRYYATQTIKTRRKDEKRSLRKRPATLVEE